MNRRQATRVGVGLLIVFGCALVIARGEAKSTKPNKAAASTGKCAGLDYQAGVCRCAKGDKHLPCPCKKCAPGAKCACAVAARKSAGTITGTIKLSRARAKTKGPKSYKDVVVYLEKVAGNGFPAPITLARMDQKGLVFIPHVLAVQKGTPIKFLNNDNDNHNVYLLYDEKGKTKTNDLGTWKPGEQRIHTFNKAKRVIALCKLHLEMAAYVVVLDNPFFTTTQIDGKTQQASFTIKNVPPGKYLLNTWHKKLKLKGGPREVVVQAGKTAKADLTITKAKYAKKK